jgi:hypothetical protein
LHLLASVKTKKNWRELALMASTETDHAKLVVLIAELSAALEEYRREINLTHDSKTVPSG